MNPQLPLLLLLTPGFPASADDRACLPMHALLARTLAARYPGVELQVIAFQYPYREEPYGFHGVHVLPMNGRNRGGLRAWQLRRKVLRRLLRINRQRAVLGVLSFWYGDCAAVGERFMQRTGVPHFCWILGQDARAANRWPARLQLPAARLLALSPFLQSEFARSHGTLPERVLLPGIDPSDFPPLPRVRDIDLMAAGSLIPLKRFDRFIALVAALKKEWPAVRAILVGAGSEGGALRALALELGVEDNLTFTGELPQPDVLLLMQRSRLFVHPSSYEGFSGVCMEALAAGARVLSHCAALDSPVPQWHIVPAAEGLLPAALDLLRNEEPQVPVQPFLMTDTVDQLATLFPDLARKNTVDLFRNGIEGQLLPEAPEHLVP
ncbi:glycosyltransferase [Flaviaesturariibacter amylovorans]|uniref:Glycosyl transferase family 1 domain-containing protein n=1 Tax=Flaviaesturariibacter amylovorans TaxID=1084520 RepID=A0ABP8HEY5_9BACT